MSSDWLGDALSSLRDLGLSIDYVASSGDGQSPEQILELVLDGIRHHLCIELRAHGNPRDMRNFAHHVASRDSSCQLVVAAPSITAAAKRYLRDEGISYLDGGGNLYLNLPHAMVLIETGARPKPLQRPKNIYERASSQVLHALLVDHDREWHITTLAEVAEASPATVHGVVTELERLGWMTRVGSGPSSTRRLVEPGELLDAWAERYSLSTYRFARFHLWRRSPDTARKVIVAALDESSVQTALTLSTGAQYVAPSVTNDPVTYIIVPDRPNIAEIMQRAGAKPVEDGGNICLLIAHSRTPLLFTQSVADATIASNIQLYLDLMAWPRRGKEQAAELRIARLGF